MANSSHVYVNVEDNRLLDKYENDKVLTIGDVQRVGLPNIEHPTTTVSSSGMVADVDVPNNNHVNAMEVTVEHNSGDNTSTLALPGKHKLEFRVARQKYDIAKASIGHELVKYIITCMHTNTENGTVENNNPLGVTERYSVLRYEKIVDGKTEVLIDAMAGTIKYGNKTFSETVSNMIK